MKYKAFIFDFDGTLVISNQLKIDAYYDIFTMYDIGEDAIAAILNDFPELNRYDTIQKIITLGKLDNSNASELADYYSKLVFERITQAPDLEFAVELLKYLKDLGLITYLSSNTPSDVLTEIIAHKGWTHYFNGIYGYPAKKTDTLKEIINSMGGDSKSYLVIGDGESDKVSASINNADFFHVYTNSLMPLINYLGLENKLLDIHDQG